MSETERAKVPARTCEPEVRPKRPYHKPAVQYERVFEVQALTCGKVQPTQGSCHSNRRTS